jgi:hypothetical protein
MLKVKNVKTDLTLDRRSINEKRDRVEQPLLIPTGCAIR